MIGVNGKHGFALKVGVVYGLTFIVCLLKKFVHVRNNSTIRYYS
jgi:hypothetical protein